MASNIVAAIIKITGRDHVIFIAVMRAHDISVMQLCNLMMQSYTVAVFLCLVYSNYLCFN